MTDNNGFRIGFIGAFLYKHFLITIGYNSSQSVTAEKSSIPHWTTSIFSSTVTDLVLIYKSVTFSASVVHWLTLHSWTLNYWTLSSLMNESVNQLRVPPL
jgi:hypothetical protein